MPRLRRRFGFAFIAFWLAIAPGWAAYPDHPIKVILGFGAGGGADILLRKIIPYVSAKLGKPMIVEYQAWCRRQSCVRYGGACGAGRLHTADGFAGIDC